MPISELTQDDLKYLLAIFNLVFSKGGISSGDAIKIIELSAKLQPHITDKPATEAPDN